MHKEVVMSAAYRQSSVYREEAAAIDGDAQYLWRFPPRRLSAEEVRDAMKRNGIRLLVDEEAVVDTPAGPVQIVGADYVRKERGAHIQELLARFPRRDSHVRLFLLHDPLGFRHVPKGDVDLTLSGHTHGGQVGLVSIGLDWTVLSRTAWPDHGLFARGRSRLYVHRGTGFYGFPLRVGVPGELSLIELLGPWEGEPLAES